MMNLATPSDASASEGSNYRIENMEYTTYTTYTCGYLAFPVPSTLPRNDCLNASP